MRRTPVPLLVVLTCGCALHEQVQYFEVVDPESKNVNYYRMTIEGHGGGGVGYQLQAGYFSAASVDVLRGQIPSIAEADLPLAQDKAYNALLDEYYQSLVKSSERRAAQSETAVDIGDAGVLALARQVWLGTLSPADVASMGMHGSTNPFAFRKLVFWASANNLDLRQFGTEIDSMIAGATALVRAHKAEHAEREGRRAGVRRLLGDVVRLNAALKPLAEAIEGLAGPKGAEHERDAKRK